MLKQLVLETAAEAIPVLVRQVQATGREWTCARLAMLRINQERARPYLGSATCRDERK